ncbi:MAG: hypothetical protein AAFQ92_28660, partial [Bacteroidota bacterium]
MLRRQKALLRPTRHKLPQRLPVRKVILHLLQGIHRPARPIQLHRIHHPRIPQMIVHKKRLFFTAKSLVFFLPPDSSSSPFSVDRYP